jgi:hypothetical protein
MTLLLEGLLVVLVLVAELVGLIALATRYMTTTETHPLEQESVAIVASDDGEGEAYLRVEWDASSCGVRGVQRKSDRSVEANFFSESEAQDCRVHIRPPLATTRYPGVRPTGGHRPEPTTSEKRPFL